MISKIVGAISHALNAEFGDNYKIYTEGIEQEMENPCFFIICNAPRYALFFGTKYFRTNIFCVQYIPYTEDIRAECNEVAERLFECLEYIKVDGRLIRGRKMEPEVKNGTLYFFLNYDFFVYRKKDVELMETLSGKVEAKGQVKNVSTEKDCSGGSE